MIAMGIIIVISNDNATMVILIGGHHVFLYMSCEYEIRVVALTIGPPETITTIIDSGEPRLNVNSNGHSHGEFKTVKSSTDDIAKKNIDRAKKQT